MKYFIALILSLALTAPALAETVTQDFTGQLPAGGTLDGTFTYQAGSIPLALNVRGLSGNATYALSDWQFTATPSQALLPYLPTPVTFNASNSTVEFCVNNCLFSSGPVESLLISNGTLNLRLAFDLPSTVPAPPNKPGDLMLRGSELYSKNVWYMVMQGGQLQQRSVPLPDTFWMLFFGVGLIVGLISLGEWRARC